MDILYVSPRIPYPPGDREVARSYHQIKCLSLNHGIDLICFSSGQDVRAARNHLGAYCRRMQIMPIEMEPQDPASVRNLMASRPLALRRFYRKDFLRNLEEFRQKVHHDVVLIYSEAMARYLSVFTGMPTLIDLVEVGSRRWSQYAALSAFPSSKIYSTEAERLRKIESEVAEAAQRTLLACEAEAEALRELCPGNQRITTLLTPFDESASPCNGEAAAPTLLFAGNLDHFPNHDAMQHFLTAILPLIRDRYPGVRMVIAGKNPAQELRELAQESDAMLVDDQQGLRQLFQDAWLAVMPHRISAGFRNEIIEAMTLTVPVVATEEAFAGIDLQPGGDLVVASDPARFADEVVGLLADQQRRRQLAAQAKKSIGIVYSPWEIKLRLEEILQVATAEMTGPGPSQP